MTDACHARREIKSALLCERAMRFMRTRARWLPEGKTALVGKLCQVTLERGVVTVAFVTGENMNRKSREWQIDEHARPSNVRRSDSKQHRESEDDNARIQQRTK